MGAIGFICPDKEVTTFENCFDSAATSARPRSAAQACHAAECRVNEGAGAAAGTRESEG